MQDSSITRPVATAHAFDTRALESWLEGHLPGFTPPLTVEQFRGGQSNPTFLLHSSGRQWVMRCKPGPQSKLLPSAHAIEREFKVMAALAGTPVPVAQMHLLCEDESVIGRAFYLMEFVQGRVLWDQALPGMGADERAAIYSEMNRVQAALHALDPAAIGLGDFGRPGNYFERQLGRWSRQYLASVTEPIEPMDRLIEWLPGHLPASARDDRWQCVVHGDFRMDNMIFHRSEPRVLAVLDWELSTLGHPLADFSYHCMTWHIPHRMGRGIAGLEPLPRGIPSEAEYLSWYCDRSGRYKAQELRADWPFYIAYNLFRMSAILQGIAKRVVDGTASSAQAREAGAGARPLAELGWQIAQRL